MSIIIYGKNAVRESVASGRAEKVKTLAKWGKDPIVAEARKRMIPVEFATESDLTRMARNPSHQGFAAICKDFSACPFEDFLSLGKKEPLLLMLDGIEDPHNMGAILRSADAFGVGHVPNGGLLGSRLSTSPSECEILTPSVLIAVPLIM